MTGIEERLAPVAFRARFPMLLRTVHLASCSLGARSERVDAALNHMLDAMARAGAPWAEFEEQADAARRRFAALVGARPGQVALVPNVSTAAYQVASTIDWRRRPAILTTTAEFPSVAHVWLAQRPRGAQVRFVGGPSEADLAAGYMEVLDGRTGLVSVPLVTYRAAARQPAVEIAAAARAVGARVFVDASQAAGVEPIDVAELGCDYLAAGSLKYLLGLPGVAFLYVREPAGQDLPPSLTGWFGRIDPFAFDPRRLDFPHEARRFETGTPPVPALYAANAGLELIGELDLLDVRTHVGGLVDRAARRLEAGGARLDLARDPAARGAHVALVDRDPGATAAWLGRRELVVSPRGDVVRISFHYYSSERDADAVCDAIERQRRGGDV